MKYFIQRIPLQVKLIRGALPSALPVAEHLDVVPAQFKVRVIRRPRYGCRARGSASRPILNGFKPWLETQLGRVSGKSPLATAIRYTLARWASLGQFVDDGRIEIDTNTVERTMRSRYR